jgi:hypothetical protein
MADEETNISIFKRRDDGDEWQRNTAKPEFATAEPTVIWTLGSSNAC